jgi:hypothetical protein
VLLCARTAARVLDNTICTEHALMPPDSSSRLVSRTAVCFELARTAAFRSFATYLQLECTANSCLQTREQTHSAGSHIAIYTADPMTEWWQPKAPLWHHGIGTVASEDSTARCDLLPNSPAYATSGPKLPTSAKPPTRPALVPHTGG